MREAKERGESESKNMKAKVQYGDLLGTSAADVSDAYNNSLQTYLSTMFESFDTSRYRCDGCRIYLTDSCDVCNVRFVCYDTQENKYVYLVPLKDYTLKTMKDMFKRFDIVVGNNIDEVVVSEDDWIDLK